MKMPGRLFFCLLALVPLVVAPPALAQRRGEHGSASRHDERPPAAQHRDEPPPMPRRRGDQQRAYEARQSGEILPLPDIERRVVPTEQRRGGQYLGFDFQSPPGIYTLKFLRDGTVIWVVVDGRTGQVIGRTDQ
jgi:hypothetical protein